MARKLKNICKNCKFCIDDNAINDKGFCEIGYTQNPTSEKSTNNALKNGAIICSRNKFSGIGYKEKKWAMAELLLAHPDSLNRSMSEFKNININFGLYLK